MKKTVVCYWSLLIVLTLTVTSCIHPKYALNQQEKAFKAKANYNEEISIYYDQAAVRNLNSTGTYTVRVDEQSLGYAYLDSNAFKARAIGIAEKVSQFMNFREHHAWIKVIFNGSVATERRDASGISPQYNYVVRMPVNDIDDAVLVNSFNTFQRKR
jgi:hypothetical protein